MYSRCGSKLRILAQGLTRAEHLIGKSEFQIYAHPRNSKNSFHSRSIQFSSLLHNHRVLNIGLLCDSSAVASSCLGLFLAVRLFLQRLHATLVGLALLV
jgi:hypothetical protein